MSNIEAKKVIARFMGQYRQWLQYRETDRHLHEQMYQLEEQLVQLETQIDHTPTEEMLADNIIMHALAMYAQSGSDGTSAEQEAPAHQLTQNFLPALQARGSFSAADTPKILQSLRQQQNAKKINAIPTTPHTELALLPEDIGAFIDEHTQTGQQRPPAWWLQTIQQNISATSQIAPGETNGQAESGTRTNHLVQRWVARWGRQLSQIQDASKDGDNE